MQTFTGKEYVKIAVANAYGLDKTTWDERIEWFDKNQSNLSSLNAGAKEPAIYYAAVKAWEDAKAGNPSGFMVGLDATSSGIQILSALVNDSKAAALCNVVNRIENGNIVRADAYRILHEAVQAKLGSKIHASYADVKQAYMTAFYASTAEPKKIFGEGPALDAFYETLSEQAPAAWFVNQYMADMWNPTVSSYEWTLPDNFHAVIKVMDKSEDEVQFMGNSYTVSYYENRPTEFGLSLAANGTHSVDAFVVRELSRRCNYDPRRIAAVRRIIDEGESRSLRSITENDRMVIALWDNFKQSGYLSARIIDYLDHNSISQVDPVEISNLIDSFPAKPFHLLSVHDRFSCLPNYANDLRKQYNLQLKLIAQSNMLQHIIQQMSKGKVLISKNDPSMVDSIMDANYALS